MGTGGRGAVLAPVGTDFAGSVVAVPDRREPSPWRRPSMIRARNAYFSLVATLAAAYGGRQHVCSRQESRMSGRRTLTGTPAEASLLESAIWTAELGAYEWDVVADRAYWLNNWCQHYDIDPCEGEAHGDRWRALVHPEDRAAARREFDEHIAGRRERYEAEYRVRTLSGGWRWIRNRAYMLHDSDGRPVRAIGACVDVSERKRMEIELGLSRRKLEALVAAAPILMMLTDAEGVIESVNRPVLGIEPAAAIGRKITSLLADPAESARVWAFHRSVVESRDPQMLTTQLDDGRAITTWARAITNGDQVVGVASATADMSERRNRERELLEAVSREQRRIGLDLHDGIGQELTGLGLMLESLALRCAREAPGILPALAAIQGHVAAALATTRAVARGASPVSREQGGLSRALEDLADYWHEVGGIPIRCRIDVEEGRPLAPLVSENLYRIAQEALTNAARHSAATQVALVLEQSAGRTTLLVRDDGRGIAPDADRGPGMGLKIMRTRAEIVGARLTVGPSTGGGTCVECVRDGG